MRRHRLALVLALSAAALCGGCIALIGAGGVAAYGSLEDRRTTGTQIEDEGIEVRAANRIAEALRERAHVNVTSFNRIVLLTGEAWDEATRAEVERIAAAVPNVRSITNEVQVAGLSSVAARASDSSLTLKVRSRMVNSREFNPLHVKVVTEAGVVYLMGIVTEREAEAATEVARTTSGVRKVVKVFDYCSPDDERCKPPKPKSAA